MNRVSRFSLPTLVVLPLLAALPACGSVDASTGSPPALATLQGQLVNSSALAVTGPVRVAVVWSAASGAFNVAEDLPVQPRFPSAFEIQLDDPPPLSAMTDGSGFGGGATAPTTANGAVPAASNLALQGGASTSSNLQVAVGTVVAYVDKNGNGKLDLVPDGASGYIDQILATNDNELVVYLQGTIPPAAADASGHMPKEGYNLYTRCDVSLPYSPSPGSTCDAGAPAPQGSCPAQAWQAISTAITLSVSSSPEVNSLMCLSDEGSSSESAGASSTPLPGRPAQYPAPCDPNLQCAPDGSSYDYFTCSTVSQGLCEGTVTSCSSVEYERLDPVPSDWPCKS